MHAFALIEFCRLRRRARSRAFFSESGNGHPTQAEILLTALLVASSSGASIDRAVAERWINDVVVLSGTGELDLVTWRPSAEYNKGHRVTHPLMAMGKEWLVEYKAETTNALLLAMTQQGNLLIRSSMMRYLRRLREPQVSTTALSCNGSRR